MNNEPVAWMFRGYLYEKDPSDWTVHEHPDVPVIPLYTHPVSKAKDRFPNYESICLQCGTTIYKPAFKTLTDEEIWELSDMVLNNSDVIGFARAILRKAQEK